MAKSNKNTAYKRGRRWGFAVGNASLKTGKKNVYKVDKAMQTCYKNAKTGIKKLNTTEKDAYRGMADGMYDAIRRAERN